MALREGLILLRFFGLSSHEIYSGVSKVGIISYRF